MLKKLFVRTGILLSGTALAVATTGCDMTQLIQGLLGDIQLPV